MSPGDDVEAALIPIKVGLRRPLEGMTLAFSTSLFGLAGSLLLGAGALALSAAQNSWMGKLESLTTLYLAPSLGAVPQAAAPAAAAAPGTVSSAGLARLEASTRFLKDAQTASDEHLTRLASTSERMGASLGDFRDRVAALATTIERIEGVLTRLQEEQGAGRQVLEQASAKLAELAGATAAMKSDIRDGQQELRGELRHASRGLREGVEKGLGDIASGLAQGPGVKELNEIVAALRSELADAASARRGAMRELVQELKGIRAGLLRTPVQGERDPRIS